MAQVTLRINGYAYIARLPGRRGRRICRRWPPRWTGGSTASRPRRGRAARPACWSSRRCCWPTRSTSMRQKLARGRTGGQPAKGAAAPDSRLGRRLGKLAKRAEDIAAALEHP